MTLTISRILHAGYIFEHGQTSIVFDPIFENPFSGNCHAYPAVQFDLPSIRQLKPAAVFISHYHDDHCSLESLALLARETPIFIYCVHPELFSYIRELGFTDVRSLDLDVAICVGEFEITPRRALDHDVDSLFHIRLGNLNVLNVVDSIISPDTLELLKIHAPWDLVLWPFQTMRELTVIAPSRSLQHDSKIPEEFIDDLRALRPRYVVPSSCQFRQEPWSWYNHALFPITYRQFQIVITDSVVGTRVVRMNPASSFVLTKNTFEPAAPLGWVLPQGDQNVDYDYQPDCLPQSTNEIAMRFSPLNPAQTTRVLEFCRAELIQRCSLLESTPYFSRPRIWSLSVFDHSGIETVFKYRIGGGRIDYVQAAAICESVAWKTEVPISRLYGALELGEALTSMYVRVNQATFAPEIEADLTDVDVLEDPLIRSLFEGRFGAYQREQLRKLQAPASRHHCP